MNETLEQRLVAALKARGLTLAAAESCTGGLAAKRLPDVPGASAVFLGGVVSYTNGVKERVLHVPHETLETYSAVSEQTARAMAEGVRALTGADLGLSVTGVAGPDRDDRGHEVGTVYIALSAGTGTQTRQLHLTGGRPAIRDRSADEMFRMLLAYIQIKESESHGKE